MFTLMARGLINTRVELDQQVDGTVRKIMKAEHRKSKREMMAILMQRTARLWDNRPQELVKLGLVKSEDFDGKLFQVAT
jgi:hypothetical protein